MEKIMSKPNDTSKPAVLEDHRPLAADELDQIAGGTPSIPIPPPAPGSGGVFTVREHMRRIYAKL
jgi:hypothetical protein